MEYFLFYLEKLYNADVPIPLELKSTIFFLWGQVYRFYFLYFNREIKFFKIEFIHDAKLHIIFQDAGI